MIVNLVSFLAISWVLLTGPAAFAANHYVCPFRDDLLNGDGSGGERPGVAGGMGCWNGLKNIDWPSVEPGDHIKLKRGETYPEAITMASSGNETTPIVFSTYGTGKNPVVSGGKRLSDRQNDWQYDEPNMRWICSRFEDGRDSTNVYSAAIVDAVPMDRASASDFSRFYGQFINNSFKKTVFADNKPWKHEIYVSVLPYNVLIDNKAYLEFSGIDFTLANGWTSPQYGAIHIVNGAHHVTFRNCRISYGAFSGVWVVGCNFVSFIKCKIYGNYCAGMYFRAGASHAIIKECSIYQNGKHLSVNDATDTGGLLMGSSGTGRGHLIEGNDVFDNGRPTVSDRIDGSSPDGHAPWEKVDAHIWKKDLSSLKRWGGTSNGSGVHYLGEGGVPAVRAERYGEIDKTHRWYWDRRTETIYYFADNDPNTMTLALEIAYQNGPDPAISLWGIADSVVRGNRVTGNYSSGIGAAYYTTTGLTIEDNIIRDNLLNGSRLHRGLSYGLHISGQGSHKVRRNLIEGNGGSITGGDPGNAGLLISTSNISPVNNTEITNNTIRNNGGFQLSWTKNLEGKVLNNTYSDYNAFVGDHFVYYMDREFNDIETYFNHSGYDKHSSFSRNP